MTLSQLQQSELEFHDSKSISRLSNERELVVLMSEDLNWRRACFLSSGQQREGMKKMRSVSSRLRALAIIVVFLSSLLDSYKKFGGVL